MHGGYDDVDDDTIPDIEDKGDISASVFWFFVTMWNNFSPNQFDDFCDGLVDSHSIPILSEAVKEFAFGPALPSILGAPHILGEGAREHRPTGEETVRELWAGNSTSKVEICFGKFWHLWAVAHPSPAQLLNAPVPPFPIWETEKVKQDI